MRFSVKTALGGFLALAAGIWLAVTITGPAPEPASEKAASGGATPTSDGLTIDELASQGPARPSSLGYWVSDPTGIAFLLHSDGTVVVHTMRTHFLDPAVGKWEIRDGRFRGTIWRSTSARIPRGHRWNDEVVQITSNELVLRTQDGEVERYRRTPLPALYTPPSLFQPKNHHGIGALPAVHEILYAREEVARAWLPRFQQATDHEANTVRDGEFLGPCAVTRVVDGDTIDVGCGQHADRIRLLNIDTPESTSVYYEIATDALAKLIAGRPVFLGFEQPGRPSRGRFDRLLAYVYDEDGRNLNLEMVRLGWSGFYIKYGEGRFPASFTAAHLESRLARRGIWSLPLIDP